MFQGLRSGDCEGQSKNTIFALRIILCHFGGVLGVIIMLEEIKVTFLSLFNFLR